jgi:hypothetical protein
MDVSDLSQAASVVDSADKACEGKATSGTVAVGVTIGVICVLLGASCYMAWDHHRINAERHRFSEFDAAARQAS